MRANVYDRGPGKVSATFQVRVRHRTTTGIVTVDDRSAQFSAAGQITKVTIKVCRVRHGRAFCAPTWTWQARR